MSLLDYNSLITLSVTLNVAYILAGSFLKEQYCRDSKVRINFRKWNAFYGILGIYFYNTCRKMSALKLELSRRAEKILNRARHCYSHYGLSVSQKKEIKRIRKELRDFINESNGLYRRCIDDAARITEIRFFPHVSLLFALAGILILFAAPMEKSQQLCIWSLLIFYDIIILSVLICFMAGDIILQNKRKAGVDITDNLNNNAYISVIAIALTMTLCLWIFRINGGFTLHLHGSSQHERIIVYETTVCVLFSNFIGYFLLVFTRLSICLLIFMTKTARIVKRYKIKECHSYLNSLQAGLKPEDISGIDLKIN